MPFAASQARVGGIYSLLRAFGSIPSRREVLRRGDAGCFGGDTGAQQGAKRVPRMQPGSGWGWGIPSAGGYQYAKDTWKVLFLFFRWLNGRELALGVTCPRSNNARPPPRMGSRRRPREGTGPNPLPRPRGRAGGHPSPPRIYLQIRPRKEPPSTINFWFSPWTLSNCLNWVWEVKDFPQTHIIGIISKALSFGPLICSVIWRHFLAITKVIYSHEDIVPG